MVTNLPGWVGPTMAISLVVIALGFAAMGLAVVALARVATREIGQLAEQLAAIRADLGPALQATKRIADSASELSGDVREEVQKYLATSQAIRRDVELGIRRVKHRLADLDALYEVMHDEFEDTALDVASKVRSVRRGVSVVRRLRRWLGRRGSRR